MWITYILLALAVMAMAKRTGRKFRKYLRGNIDHKLLLSTLGANTLIGSLVADTVVDTTWMSSVKATWAIGDFTNAVGDGPITVGIAHSDYTDAEVEAFVENITGSWDAADLVSQEIARRKIRVVGTFQSVGVAATTLEVLNDGNQITTKAGWMLSEGQTVRIWAYNAGDSSLTDGTRLHVNGHANLWPQ